MSNLKLLELVEFDECPPQTNGHDCGLFAVAVLLHLVEALDDLVDSAATAIAKVEENEVINVWTAKEGNDGSKNPTKAAVAKGAVNIDDDDDDNDDDVNNDDDDDDEQDEDNDIDYSDEECDVNESDDEELRRERDKGNVSSLAGSTAEQPESSLSGSSEDERRGFCNLGRCLAHC